MKKFKVLAMVALFTLLITSCNQQVFDFKLKFDKALVKFPDGKVATLDIKAWSDYEGDQIQVITADGVVYVFHASNCVLVGEE